MYEVESIQAHRVTASSGLTEYLVRWKGYTSADDTWEPVANMLDAGLISRYEGRSEQPVATAGELAPGAVEDAAEGDTATDSGEAAATTPSRRSIRTGRAVKRPYVGDDEQPRSTPGARRAEQGLSLLCPAGHSLSLDAVGAQQLLHCDRCTKPLHAGYALYSCPRCDYDVCTPCATA